MSDVIKINQIKIDNQLLTNKLYNINYITKSKEFNTLSENKVPYLIKKGDFISWEIELWRVNYDNFDWNNLVDNIYNYNDGDLHNVEVNSFYTDLTYSCYIYAYVDRYSYFPNEVVKVSIIRYYSYNNDPLGFIEYPESWYNYAETKQALKNNESTLENIDSAYYMELQTFTLSIWVNINSSETNPVLFAFFDSGATSNAGWSFGYTSAASNYISFYNISSSEIVQSQELSSNIDNNTRKHIVLTYNNKEVTFYENGVQKGQQTISNDIIYADMRNYIYCAGLPADIVGNYDFSGYIDNVNIYKTALSENQIRLLFKNKEL